MLYAIRVLTLFLNTASQNGQIALVTEGTVLSMQAVSPKVPEDELVTSITTLLTQNSKQFADLTHVACITGPGGFTSLRISASAINTLATTLQIPSCGIHEAELYNARITEPDVLWLHSTKKDLVFAQGFGKHAEVFAEPTCKETDAVAEYMQADTLITGELMDAHQEQFAVKDVQWCALNPIEDVLPALLQAQKYTTEPVLPWYGRGW